MPEQTVYPAQCNFTQIVQADMPEQTVYLAQYNFTQIVHLLYVRLSICIFLH